MRLNDKVQWANQMAQKLFPINGKIVAIIPHGKTPSEFLRQRGVDPSLCDFKLKKHKSYVVEDANGDFLWPEASKLQEV